MVVRAIEDEHIYVAVAKRAGCIYSSKTGTNYHHPRSPRGRMCGQPEVVVLKRFDIIMLV
jgi:hypothetical protein